MSLLKYRGCNVVRFYSNAQEWLTGDENHVASCNAYMLSNFYYAPVIVKPSSPIVDVLERVCPSFRAWITDEEICFSCNEALWQSLKSREQSVFEIFHGKRGTFGRGTMDPRTNEDLLVEIDNFRFLLPVKEMPLAGKKYKHWAPKRMVGIWFKMIVNTEKLSRHPLLKLAPYNITRDSFITSREFLETDREKEVWCAILKLKFESHPPLLKGLLATGNDYLLEFDARATDATHWGGKLSEMADGSTRLVGANRMGQFMMLVRDELRQKAVK